MGIPLIRGRNPPISNDYSDYTFGGGSGIRCIAASHHVTISYNEVHHCGANGISAEEGSDYMFIASNTVRNCAGDSPFHCSGISLFNQNWADYDNQGIHSRITNNLVYNNKEPRKCSLLSTNSIDMVLLPRPLQGGSNTNFAMLSGYLSLPLVNRRPSRSRAAPRRA
ncbi:MAG: right-handed parallel beta-helix repeat-containing protein [Fibrella sp.]|nr:right-handed parallel beta-helix repeat-containing protein [Armatimonadota bacterium]